MESPDEGTQTRYGSIATTSFPATPALAVKENANKPDLSPSTEASATHPDATKAIVHARSYRTTDVPSWKSAWFLALQHCAVCISGILSAPYIIASLSCAGSATIAVRVKLISTTFVVTGVSTLLQTTFGLRLAILQGPSFAFLPPILAFTDLPDMKCHAGPYDDVPEEQYLARIQTIQGSLAGAAVMLMLIGATGFVGVTAKHIGPVTITPLLLLICLGNIPVFMNDAQKHWISLVSFGLIIVFGLFFAETKVPLPYVTRKGIRFVRFRLFGQYAYLLSIVLTWILAFMLGATGLEPEEGEARVDKNLTMNVLRESPWFQVPYPAQFGMPRFSVGLFLGFLASCVACCVESLGSYGILAEVCKEKPPPASTLNRAIMTEGFGAFLAGLTGCCIGITTYSQNVAVVSMTRVASRFTMQLAGIILILLGLFTKVGAVMATIPDAVVGGILAMGVCMIAGVSLSNLPSVDLKLSRNLTIMGLAVITGMSIPDYFSNHPIHTGVAELDQMFNILLNIQMFIGGVIAFILDNTVGGATYEQRGLRRGSTSDSSFEDCGTHLDGYSYPYRVNRFLLRYSDVFCRLPFMPSVGRLEASCANAAEVAVGEK